jgi:hypothetical protein
VEEKAKGDGELSEISTEAPVSPDLRCPACDAAEPEPAKVIVVTEPKGDGSSGRELRYDANQAHVTDWGQLSILRKGREVGGHQAPGWLSWRDEDALVPDATAKALGIAKRALTGILKRSEDYDQPFGRPEVGDAASTALNDIWNETEG